MFLIKNLKKVPGFFGILAIFISFVPKTYSSQDTLNVKQLSLDEIIQRICIYHDSLKFFVKYIPTQDSTKFVNTIQDYIDFYENNKPSEIFIVRERGMKEVEKPEKKLHEYTGNEQFKQKYGQYENFFSTSGPRAQIKKYFRITNPKEKIEKLKTLEFDKLLNEYSRIEQLIAQENSEFVELLKGIGNKKLVQQENIDTLRILLSNVTKTDQEKVKILHNFYNGILFMIDNQERTPETKEILYNILPFLGIDLSTELSKDVIANFDNKYSTLLDLEKKFDLILSNYRDRLIDYKNGKTSYKGNALEFFILAPILNFCYKGQDYIVSPLEPLARVIPVALYNSTGQKLQTAYTIQFGFIWNKFPSYTDIQLNQTNYFYQGIAFALARCDWTKISFNNDGDNGIGLVYLHSYGEVGAFWFKDSWAFSIGINDYTRFLGTINRLPIINKVTKVLPFF